MLSVLRRAVAVASLVAVSASVAQAQVKVEEIRLDLVGFQTQDGYREFGVGAPGAVAIGIYLNDKIALEPSIAFANIKIGDFDAENIIQFGLFAPYYLAGDRGKSGLFLAPGLNITKVGDADAAIDFGADVGYKKPISDKVSWRAAAGIRTGDSTADELRIGGTFGFSIFWR